MIEIKHIILKYIIVNFGMKSDNNGTIGDHTDQSSGIKRT